jgi:hypothetical protein
LEVEIAYVTGASRARVRIESDGMHSGQRPVIQGLECHTKDSGLCTVINVMGSYGEALNIVTNMAGTQ